MTTRESAKTDAVRMTDEQLLRAFYAASHDVYAIHGPIEGDATGAARRWRELDTEFLNRSWESLTPTRREELFCGVAAMRRSLELVEFDARRDIARRTPLRDFSNEIGQLLNAAEILASGDTSRDEIDNNAGTESASGFLGLIVNDVDKTIRRAGYEHVAAINLSNAPAQWHTFFVAFQAGEYGATQTQWLNGYPGDEEPSRRRNVKRDLKNKLQSIGLSLTTGEGVQLIEWDGH